MGKFAGAAIRSSVACILIYERMSTNGGLLEATRTRPLDDDHITIPDELEKNGQPQNEKMKFESSKHETKLSMKLTAQVQARILSNTHRV